MTYGQHLTTEASHDIVKRIVETVAIVAGAAAPATAPLVEVFPILEHVPEWLAGWKREARRIQRQSTKMYNGFLADVAERMVCMTFLVVNCS